MDSLKYFQKSIKQSVCSGLSDKFTEELYRSYITEDESLTIYLDTEEYALSCASLTDFVGVSTLGYPFDAQDRNEIDNYLKLYNKDFNYFKDNYKNFGSQFEKFKIKNEKNLNKLTSDEVAMRMIFTIYTIVSNACSIGEFVEEDEW